MSLTITEIYCTACGQRLELDSRFCGSCGQQVRSISEGNVCAEGQPLQYGDDEGVWASKNNSCSTSLDIKGWSWGAFFYPALWLCVLDIWDLGIIAGVINVAFWVYSGNEDVFGFMALLNLAIMFVMGFRGNEIACKKKAFRDISHFLVFRRSWNRASWLAVAYIIYAYWPWLSGQVPASEFFLW